VLFALTSLLFASAAYDAGHRIGFQIGYAIGVLFWPALVLFLLFRLRDSRGIFWYIGVCLCGGFLLLQTAFLVVVGVPEPVGSLVTLDPAHGDGVCHLHLRVPEDAEVFVDGARTSEKGTHREFVTPLLHPGAHSRYKVSVRYTDQQGRKVDDTRDVPVVANELVRLDFTPAARPK
jgi:uncharacterized protein (TIGR03000 family)